MPAVGLFEELPDLPAQAHNSEVSEEMSIVYETPDKPQNRHILPALNTADFVEGTSFLLYCSTLL